MGLYGEGRFLHPGKAKRFWEIWRLSEETGRSIHPVKKELDFGIGKARSSWYNSFA